MGKTISQEQGRQWRALFPPRLAASVDTSKSMWFRMSRPLEAAFSRTRSSTVPTVPLTDIMTERPKLQGHGGQQAIVETRQIDLPGVGYSSVAVFLPVCSAPLRAGPRARDLPRIIFSCRVTYLLQLSSLVPPCRHTMLPRKKARTDPRLALTIIQLVEEGRLQKSEY